MLSKSNKEWSSCSYSVNGVNMSSSGGNTLSIYNDYQKEIVVNFDKGSTTYFQIHVYPKNTSLVSADPYDTGTYSTDYYVVRGSGNNISIGDVSIRAGSTVYAYEVIFDSNGGSSIDTGVTEYSSGTTTKKSFTIPDTIPSRDNCTFLGWGDSLYQPGETITLSGDITLVAQWQTNLYVKANGNWVNASNVYVKVNGNWKEIDSVHTKISGNWKQVL